MRLLGALVLISLVGCTSETCADGALGPCGVAIGERLPDYEWLTSTGHPIRLSKLLRDYYSPRHYILVFTSSAWCEACKVAEKYLGTHYEEAVSRGGAFLGIMTSGPDESKAPTPKDLQDWIAFIPVKWMAVVNAVKPPGQLGIDLAAVYADPKHGIPLRVHAFVLEVATARMAEVLNEDFNGPATWAMYERSYLEAIP